MCVCARPREFIVSTQWESKRRCTYLYQKLWSTCWRMRNAIWSQRYVIFIFFWFQMQQHNWYLFIFVYVSYVSIPYLSLSTAFLSIPFSVHIIYFRFLLTFIAFWMAYRSAFALPKSCAECSENAICWLRSDQPLLFSVLNFLVLYLGIAWCSRPRRCRRNAKHDSLRCSLRQPPNRLHHDQIATFG